MVKQCFIYRFYDIFQDKEYWLVAISNPMLKLSWLDEEGDLRKARTYINSAFERKPQQQKSTSRTRIQIRTA